jgi:hypothetical protein
MNDVELNQAIRTALVENRQRAAIALVVERAKRISPFRVIHTAAAQLAAMFRINFRHARSLACEFYVEPQP